MPDEILLTRQEAEAFLHKLQKEYAILFVPLYNAVATWLLAQFDEEEAPPCPPSS